MHRTVTPELRALLRCAIEAIDEAAHPETAIVQTEHGDAQVEAEGSIFEFYPPGGRELWVLAIHHHALEAAAAAATVDAEVHPLGDVQDRGPVRPLEDGEVARDVDARLLAVLRLAYEHGLRHQFAWGRPDIQVPHAEIAALSDTSTMILYAPESTDASWEIQLYAEELKVAAAGGRPVPVRIDETGG